MGSIPPGDTGVSPWSRGVPGSPPAPSCSGSHVLSPAWRNATGLHRRTVRSSLVELILPVRMPLNMVFITLNSVCPCNEVPREGVLSRRGRGRSSVFILGVLTHVTETIFLFKVAARMPRDKSTAHLSQTSKFVYEPHP